MTSYFPDVNTWLALAWDAHVHHAVAAAWFEGVPEPSRFLFSRYSQLGLLRLVTNAQVMAESAVSLEQAFALYDRLLEDPRIELRAEPQGIEGLMRSVSRPFARQSATKVIGDLYLIAFAVAAEATTVTFDKAMARALRLRQSPVLLLS
jgi:toxin-antitoxin system PIN domain toxin